MMKAPLIIERARESGIAIAVVDDRLRYWPKSATPPDLVELMRRHKAELIDYLKPDKSKCKNSLTPHANHEHPWECYPETCVCYRNWEYPKLCQGVPCRWVWPDGVPGKERAS